MKRKFYYLLLMLLSFNILNIEKINAQLTGTKNIPGSYATLAIAISTLNSSGVGAGGVTLNLLAGNPQTAPIGGYRITAIGTAANTITIKGNGNIITASGSQPIGSIKDAVFMIKGGDYITIDSFVIRENPANTINNNGGVNNMTEWGIALLHASTTNGAQNNTIKNCTISLNKNYINTFGIYSNTAHDTIDVYNASNITSTSGANSNNRVYSNSINNVGRPVSFVGSSNPAFMDNGNDIGGSTALTGNTITDWNTYGGGYYSVPGVSVGISLYNETGSNVSFNSLSSTININNLRGIYQDFSASPTGNFVNMISDNTITLSGIATGVGGGSFDAIFTNGGVSTMNLNISNNAVLNCLFSGNPWNIKFITSFSPVKILNINNNVFQGNVSNAPGFTCSGIVNKGIANDSININNNQIGNNSGGLINFNTGFIGGGGIDGITNALGTTTAAISISNNNFQGINYTAASTDNLRFIFNQTTSCGSININNNTFTNLNVNTSGNITFIISSGQRNAGTYCNVNNNSIVTGFNNIGTGGFVRLYDGGNFSSVNTIETNSNNNFSNIITGGSLGTLWSNREICGKIISNNIFSNISGHGSPNVIYILGSDTSSSVRNVSNNSISNISADGPLIGIYSDSRATNVLDNNINSLSSTGASVIGIYSSNVTQNLFRNKIYNLQVSNINGSVYGISLSGGNVNVYNNLIGDLKAPLTNRTTDAIIGLNLLSSSVNVYFNTIYLNSSSTGTNFSTSGIYHTASSSALSVPMNLRNNIIMNTSTPNGTGKTVVYRRSSNALNNYSSPSNNNLFYAGIPGSSKLIFYDGTNSDQTVSAYKTRVAPRDSNSFTENPNFLSLSGANANFLHIDSTIATQIESGGINISGITDDYDGNIRNAMTPDVGADEFNGTHTLTITALIEGFYDNNSNLLITDTLRAYIRDSFPPYAVVDSAKNYLNTSGSGVFNFPNAVNGINYFLQIKHRNSIETWSASDITFSLNSAVYDFSSSQSSAFGNNLKLKGSRYCIYGGDVNQDGTIDASDLSQTENDASVSLSGYVNTDLNGDEYVDAADLSIVENNIGINVVTP